MYKLIEDLKNTRGQKIDQTKKLQKKTEDMNKLVQKMELVLVENSYLREICQVKDDQFGVDLNDVSFRKFLD